MVNRAWCFLVKLEEECGELILPASGGHRSCIRAQPVKLCPDTKLLGIPLQAGRSEPQSLRGQNYPPTWTL